MTLHDLCMYSMNDFEKQVWDNLIADIKNRIFEADIPDVPLNIIEHQVDNNTAICIHYQRYKGYHRMEGFYDIAMGDRGGENELLLTKDGEKAKNHLLEDIAHDISFEYTISTPEYKAGLNIPINERDPRDDYRKDWFALLLQIEKRVLKYEEFRAEIIKYEKCMNHHFKSQFWVFDENSMEFWYNEGETSSAVKL